MTHLCRNHQTFALISFLLVSLTLGSSDQNKGAHGIRIPRVVGGLNADEGQFKYTASLQIFNQLHYCGGAIISKRAILTAAHCRKLYPIVAMVGSVYYQNILAKRYRVKKFIVHELFDSLSLNFDLSVAILEEDIVFDQNVQPIALPSKRVLPGDRMILSGWGYTHPPLLLQLPAKQMQWMKTSVIDDEICHEYHSEVNSNICIYEGKDHGICSGDSGGPLVNEEGELVGIISAGYPCAIGYPDSCTDVFKLKKWILNHCSV